MPGSGTSSGGFLSGVFANSTGRGSPHSIFDELPPPKFTNPFTAGEQVKARTSRFFLKNNSTHSYAGHIRVVKVAPIGRTLLEITGGEQVQITEDYFLQGAVYHHVAGSRMLGNIRIGELANALLIGHELRHACQFMTLPGEVLSPQSPEEAVLLGHFLEADGRAFEFGLTIQIVNEMRLMQDEDGYVYGNEYAHNLLASLDDYEKEVLEYSLPKLKEICNSPEKFKQAMRQVFDLWITIAPNAPEAYREETEKTLDMAISSEWKHKVMGVLKDGLTMRPNYISRGIRPEYVQKLVESLGNLGPSVPGNYLTDTKGLDFTSEFYTRVCDFRIEDKVHDTLERLGLDKS